MEAEGSSADGISRVKVGHGGMGFWRLDLAPDGWSAVVGGVYTIQPTTTNSTLPSLPWWTTALWKWSEVNLSAPQLLPSGILSGWLGSSYLRTVLWLHVYSVPASREGNIPCHLFRLVATVYRRLLQTGTVETLGTQTKGNWAGTGRARWVRTTTLVAMAASLSTHLKERDGTCKSLAEVLASTFLRIKLLSQTAGHKPQHCLFEIFFKWFHEEKRKVIWVQAATSDTIPP